MTTGGPALFSRERTQYIMSRISALIAESVIQAEVRAMPRSFSEAVPQLGDFTYPEFFDRHKGQIIDEYLYYYNKYWGSDGTSAGVPPSRSHRSDRVRHPALSNRLYDYRAQLNGVVQACVQRRARLRSWDDAVRYLVASVGHDREELGRHKYHILDLFLSHWADAVKRDAVRLQIFPAIGGHISHQCVYLVAAVRNSVPKISRDLVETMRLSSAVDSWNKLHLDFRLADSPHFGQMGRMMFWIVDPEEVESSPDGIVVPNDIGWWIMQRRHSDIEEVYIEDLEDQNPEMEGT
ncbi:xylosidase [Colletotrichum plurivorum]|uniref:Xylosidase n=1 Tax=Colletotrichum plurivorum TaxID=2175906 RepID=A0A8H6K600_9PEZI|nr:xylosidase [Colletotrichum plurivorum]